MKLQLLNTLASQRKSWTCILLALTSCFQISEEKQQADKSILQMSQEVCECFNKQKGDDIDAKLGPCINQVAISSHTVTLKEGHSYQDSVDAINTVNTLASKDINNAVEITNSLVASCDAFGSEMEALYDRWYPIDSSASNLIAIKKLSNEFQKVAASDTISKEILNKLIAKDIEARRLEEGLQRCNQMKILYKEEEGAYYASAFIYQLQKKYPLAIRELEQEIYIYKKPDLKLIVAVIKRKAQRDNDERQRNY
jgi:hypothetical protein